MTTFVSIMIAIFVFGFMVFFHELGHFLVARACGIGVVEFSIGMGPRLVSWQGKATRYSIKLLPFGGSCAMLGEDQDEEANQAEDAFGNKPAWKRFLTVLAGPFFNFVLAFILAVIFVALAGINRPVIYSLDANGPAAQAGIRVGDEMYSVGGKRIRIGRDLIIQTAMNPLEGDSAEVVVLRGGEKLSFTVDTVEKLYLIGISYYADSNPAALATVSEGGAAAQAGLQPGDVIVSLNGTEIASGKDLQAYFNSHSVTGDPITVEYLRGEEKKETQLVPHYSEKRSLGLYCSDYYAEPQGVGEVLAFSFQEMRYGVAYVIGSLRMLVRGQVGIRDMSGPVAIVQTIDTVVDTSMENGGAGLALINVLMLAVLLNVNLGVINLLPIPALDGGRLLLLLIEMILRKRLPVKVENTITFVSFILLMLLIGFVFISDILKLFGI